MDSYKILKQAQPGDTDWAQAYTCPVATATTVGGIEVAPEAVGVHTQTLVTSILVAGQGATNTYSIGLKETSNEDDPAAENIIVYVRPIAQYANDVLSLGLTLSADNTLWFKQDSGTVSYTIMGIEIT